MIEFAKDVDPNDIMLGQKWELYGQGKTTVCKDSGTFATLGNSVGAETHTLIISEMPSHSHTMKAGITASNSHIHTISKANIIAACPTHVSDVNLTPHASNPDFTPKTGITGEGQAHNNIQPSIVVLRWQRTA